MDTNIDNSNKDDNQQQATSIPQKSLPDYNSGSATGSLRSKVALKPGHSLMGWIKLAASAKDLAGTNGRRFEVTPEELAKHNKEDDCWLALKGNVYNVTSYFQYHPGGEEELMRGAGRDATNLFNEVHQWVNYEQILAKCLIGPYKVESPLPTIGLSSLTVPNFERPKEPQPARRDPSVKDIYCSSPPAPADDT